MGRAITTGVGDFTQKKSVEHGTPSWVTTATHQTPVHTLPRETRKEKSCKEKENLAIMRKREKRKKRELPHKIDILVEGHLYNLHKTDTKRKNAY